MVNKENLFFHKSNSPILPISGVCQCPEWGILGWGYGYRGYPDAKLIDLAFWEEGKKSGDINNNKLE